MSLEVILGSFHKAFAPDRAEEWLLRHEGVGNFRFEEIQMFRRTFAIMLSGLLLLTAFGYQGAGAQSRGDSHATEKIRSKVLKLGVGGNARVDVKLKDNTQFRGYISDANQDSFTVVERTTGSSKTVSYSDTTSVKKASSGWSAKSWIILGAVAVGAAVTWVVVKPALCDGGAQTRGPC